MTARKFIDVVTAGITEVKLKIVDKDGNWCDVNLDDEMPDEIFGYAIYTKAEFPTSFIAELQKSGLVANG